MLDTVFLMRWNELVADGNKILVAGVAQQPDCQAGSRRS
jgi:hypothetical protein